MAGRLKYVTIGTVLVAVGLTCSMAQAYDTYASCKGCHPFNGSGPQAFDHNLHRRTLTTDCAACHITNGDLPFIGIKDRTKNTGCVGCHGRFEDDGNDVKSPGTGAGLRQHHTLAGITSCKGCHSDADPATFTPVGENVLPPFYSKGLAANNDPCTDNLDNDGDLLVDAADPDCQPQNQPPVAVNDSYSIVQDGLLDVVAGNGVLANDTDADGDTLTVRLIASPLQGTLTAFTAGGAFTYIPASGYNGPDSFTYVANDGTDDSNVATVSITVTPLPNRPPVAQNDTYTTQQDVALVVAAPGVLGNDSDADGDPITAILDTNVANGTLSLNGSGGFDYIPNAGFFGVDTFSYVANDGTDNSNIANVTITVTEAPPANNPPVALDDAYTTAQDATLDVPLPGVLSNDSDADNDPLTAVVSTNVAHGSLNLRADGSFAYVPSPGYFGTDSFAYVANDGTDDSNVATVTITITEAPPNNEPPVARDDAYTVGQDTLLDVPAPGVLGNDTDPNSDPLTSRLIADGTNGSAVVNADGSIGYLPNPGFTGQDTFIYVANDGQLDSNQATVTITVTAAPVNQAPIASNDAYSTDTETPLQVPAPGILGNDLDPDGDPITARLDGDVSNGTLTLNMDGSFEYLPAAGFVGIDSFTYVANDGSLDSNIATVAITVTEPPQPGAVDLDIVKFKVTKKVKLVVTDDEDDDDGDDEDGDDEQSNVEIRLLVVNPGTDMGERPAMVVGVQAGIEVYAEIVMVFAEPGGKGMFAFPAFTPTMPGKIKWTVTIDDDDSDIDEAKAKTKVELQDDDDHDDDHDGDDDDDHDGDDDDDDDDDDHDDDKKKDED